MSVYTRLRKIAREEALTPTGGLRSSPFVGHTVAGQK
jgi:hypothetical protein